MKLDREDLVSLRALIAEVVRAVLAEIAKGDSAIPTQRLAFREAEAAALLGIPPNRLRDARARGQIKARKLGVAWLYPREELIRFLRGTKCRRAVSVSVGQAAPCLTIPGDA